MVRRRVTGPGLVWMCFIDMRSGSKPKYSALLIAHFNRSRTKAADFRGHLPCVTIESTVLPLDLHGYVVTSRNDTLSLSMPATKNKTCRLLIDAFVYLILTQSLIHYQNKLKLFSTYMPCLHSYLCRFKLFRLGTSVRTPFKPPKRHTLLFGNYIS